MRTALCAAVISLCEGVCVYGARPTCLYVFMGQGLLCLMLRACAGIVE